MEMKFPVGTLVRAVLHHTVGDVGIVESAREASYHAYKNGAPYLQYTITLLDAKGDRTGTTRGVPEFWLERPDSEKE